MKRISKIVLVFISVIIISLIGLAGFYREINIFPHPDLIPEDLQIISMNATSVSIFWKLKNIGDEIIPLENFERKTGNSSNICLYAYVSKDTIIRNPDDSLRILIWVKSNNKKELAPQQSMEGYCMMSIPNVKYHWKYLMMHIDPNNKIDESNEDNNIAYVALTSSEIESIWGDGEEEIADKDNIASVVEDENIILDTISFDHFLGLFEKGLPSKFNFSRATNGQSLYRECPEISNKVVLFDNGKILPRIRGFAYAYKQINEDIFWITCRSLIGEYGASEDFYLSIINRKEGIISKTFKLASAFGEDGYFDRLEGEFINDSSYQYKHIWNDENYKTDSTSGVLVIK